MQLAISSGVAVALALMAATILVMRLRGRRAAAPPQPAERSGAESTPQEPSALAPRAAGPFAPPPPMGVAPQYPNAPLAPPPPQMFLGVGEPPPLAPAPAGTPQPWPAAPAIHPASAAPAPQPPAAPRARRPSHGPVAFAQTEFAPRLDPAAPAAGARRPAPPRFETEDEEVATGVLPKPETTDAELTRLDPGRKPRKPAPPRREEEETAKTRSPESGSDEDTAEQSPGRKHQAHPRLVPRSGLTPAMA